MNIVCPSCGAAAELRAESWRCECGAAWEPAPLRSFDPSAIASEVSSLWRYIGLFDLGLAEPSVDLGAGWTALLPLPLAGRTVHAKVEYFGPTLSFKDRGTSLMINALASLGVRRVIEDSSGNAGASIAAHAARAGMRADIYVPAHASSAKQTQIAIYGAEVHAVSGPRIEATIAAQAAAVGGAVYASHAYNPAFLLGQESVAWEVWEQLGRRAPDWYVVPVGQGVHLLGAWLGFERLRAAGLIEKSPRMVGVQPRLMNPVARAFAAGEASVAELEATRPSLAEGLAISKPVRGERVLRALRESSGFCVTVEEAQILQGQAELARLGLYVEPSSAVVAAALPELVGIAGEDDRIVLALTGSGLKGAPSLRP